jgi:hypothetical protein
MSAKHVAESLLALGKAQGLSTVLTRLKDGPQAGAYLIAVAPDEPDPVGALATAALHILEQREQGI